MVSAELRLLSVRDCHQMVEAGALATGYRSERVLSDADEIAPLAFADCPIAVRNLVRRPS